MSTAPRTDRFRKLESDSWDVIVIGAGIGGLTAAALLAQRGKKVLIVDQHYVAGGNATIFKRPGYEFDVGLHYLGDCGPGESIPSILAAAGVHDVRFTQMDPDGFDTVVLPGLEFRVPRDIDRYRARLISTFPSERRGIDRYIDLLRGFEVVQRTAVRPSAALGALPKLLGPLRWLNGTLEGFLDTCTHDPQLRTVLAAESGDYGQPPSRASLTLHMMLMLHYLKSGGWYPEGGGQVMSDKLAESIERAGGKLLLSTLVERIVVENGRARGVVLSNKHLGTRTVKASTVIANADIKQVLLKLVEPDALASKTRKRASGWEMSPGLGAVYMGVKPEALPSERNTNYWIYPNLDIEAEYRRVFAQQFSDDPFAYVSIASLKDPTNPRLAPEGVVNLQLMSLAPNTAQAWGVTEQQLADGSYRKSERYAELKQQYTERLKRSAERALPGMSEHVVFEELSTPLTHSRYTLSSGGTSYGIALTPDQFLWKRPDAKTEIDGLLLCGASCRTGHGIMGAMMSGLTAAARVVGGSVMKETFGPNRVSARVPEPVEPQPARTAAPARAPAPPAE